MVFMWYRVIWRVLQCSFMADIVVVLGKYWVAIGVTLR